MPETKSSIAPDTDSAAIVREFYSALSAGDAARLRAIVEENFAADATLTWPGSLPHGGALVGASRIARVLSRAVDPEAKGGPTNMHLLGTIGNGSRIVAEVAFELAPAGQSTSIPTTALELWTLAKGKVASIDAYYWDTHLFAASAGA